MFSASQLVEISQQFQPDIEDLRVLLQEEGLPVGSTMCLEGLSSRLGTDRRFRHDVGFLVRSMLGREGGELGSMDVLGVLVVAAAGTWQAADSPSGQQAMRELLRFVLQQRRPAAAAAVAETVAPLEPEAATTPISPPQAAERERRPAAPPTVAPDPVAVPALLVEEPEPLWRRARVGWVVAVVVVLIALGAGLAILRGSGRRKTRDVAALATAPQAASTESPVASQPAPERRVIRPPSRRTSGKPAPSPRHAIRRRPEQVRESEAVAANTPPRTIETPEPARNAPQGIAPASSGAVQPMPHPHESAAVSEPANVTPQRSAPVSAPAISNPFAHPEASSTAADSQVPAPEFRTKDPVLIARNAPPASGIAPVPQGSVHTGSTGNMASNLMYSPDPEYPAEAIASGIEGEVTVRVVVGPNGNVIDARVVSGPPLLREAALDAVGRWRYRPYEQDGKPVSMATTAIFDFQLPPKG